MFALTLPVLRVATVTVVVLPPAVLRNVPALNTRGLPPTRLKHVESACKSNVAAGALLNIAPLSKLTTPPLHVPATLLTSAPLDRALIATPLTVRVPFTRTIGLELALPIVPVTQLNGPSTVVVPLPASIPPVNWNAAGATTPVEFCVNVPAARTSVLFVATKLPSNVLVPLNVFVPSIRHSP